MSSDAVAEATAAPWRRSSRLLLAVLLAVGFAGLMVGYWGVSGTRQLSDQVVWVNVAAAGLLVAGAGVALFLAAGRRAVGRRRLALFGDVAPSVAAAEGSSAGLVEGELVAADKMTRYHLAECAFVAGKAAKAATISAHEQAGREPCGVCLGGAGEASA